MADIERALLRRDRARGATPSAQQTAKRTEFLDPALIEFERARPRPIEAIAESFGEMFESAAAAAVEERRREALQERAMQGLAVLGELGRSAEPLERSVSRSHAPQSPPLKPALGAGPRRHGRLTDEVLKNHRHRYPSVSPGRRAMMLTEELQASPPIHRTTVYRRLKAIDAAAT